MLAEALQVGVGARVHAERLVQRKRAGEQIERLLGTPGECPVAREVVKQPGVVGVERERALGMLGGRRDIAPLSRVQACAHRLPPLPYPEDAAELGDRLGVILDAEVADPIYALSTLGGRARALDDERRRLLAARVAARLLPGLERRHEAVWQSMPAVSSQARSISVEDGLAREDVPLHGIARPGAVARPRRALRAGESGGATVGGDHAELTGLAARIVVASTAAAPPPA